MAKSLSEGPNETIAYPCESLRRDEVEGITINSDCPYLADCKKTGDSRICKPYEVFFIAGRMLNSRLGGVYIPEVDHREKMMRRFQANGGNLEVIDPKIGITKEVSDAAELGVIADENVAAARHVVSKVRSLRADPAR